MKKITLLIFVLLCSTLNALAVTEIKFWQFWDPEFKPLIEKFEKENPNIKVSLERLTWTDGFNKILKKLCFSGPFQKAILLKFRVLFF